MRARVLAVAAVAVMLAAAFFLPELLLAWDDGHSLDVLQMDAQDTERAGFAESIQLSAAEKVMMLRSGAFIGMDLDRTKVESITLDDSAEVTVRYYAESGEIREAPPELMAGAEEDIARYNAETGQLWEERAAAAGAELRTLQSMGGLPELWKSGSETPDYTGYGDLLYLDPDGYMSFQAYQLTLYWESCSIDLLVDAQSGRILSFLMHWNAGSQPNWGLRGASGFGGAWRDYWGMDSVSTGWYNENARSLLEGTDAQAMTSGEYAAHDQINFMYDSQSVSVPLNSQGSRGRNGSIVWNR